MWTLGINWRWHDSAAAIVDDDGRVVAFAEEERFSRLKHAWNSFPVQSTAYCLTVAGLQWRDITTVAVGWATQGLDSDVNSLLSQIFGDDYSADHRPEVVFVEHHLAHALSTYHASGCARAGILVVDGSGEVDSATVYSADPAGSLKKLRSWDRRYSVGSVYSAASQEIGFGPLDAGKTMGLAPFGRGDETLVLPVGDLISGEVNADSPVANFSSGQHFDEFVRAWRRYFQSRWGKIEVKTGQLQSCPAARAIAMSAQRTVEETLRGLYAETVSLTGTDTVCLAGGVALNCVANGLLPADVYVPPFPHDAGVALGAAWFACPPKRRLATPITPYLGLEIDASDQLDRVRARGHNLRDFTPEHVTDLLLQGLIGAVAEGRAEIGPRALGHRSIIALPKPAKVQARVNDLKQREHWRPFAPVSLRSAAASYWPTQGVRELYMNGTAVVSATGRRDMPAIAHIDGTTRPQTISDDSPGVVAALLHELRKRSLPPALINTSFNGPAEPIVNSARDAVDCYTSMALDFLVLGDTLITPASHSVDL